MELALITGVSRQQGLGLETAKQLKNKGFEVIITARDLETARQLAAPHDLKALAIDVRNEQSIAGAARQVELDFGRLDVLVNNAGGYYDQGGTVLGTDMEYVSNALDTNLMGAWRMIKAFKPLLIKSPNPRIVNVSSGAGSFSDEVFGMAVNPGGVPAYGISKLALNGLTIKCAREFTADSIKINSVCPGFVATYPGTENWGARPVSEGAAGIVWAASLPADGPTGQFFRDGKVIPW